ncbi:MAG: NAD(P)H-hydrate dehydratase [Flavobacteriales bacterium]
MVPVLSNKQVRAVELATIAAGITGRDLMERAGRVAAEFILDRERAGSFGPGRSYVILAGQGNNGGDGLVVARLLHEAGRTVRIVLLGHGTKTADVVIDLVAQLPKEVRFDQLDTSLNTIELIHNEVIIDAILGSGVTRPVTGWLAEIFDRVNASGLPVVAIDMPSGTLDPMEGDGIGPQVQAHYTITFEVPRPAMLVPETGPAFGSWAVRSIGLDAKALERDGRVGEWVEGSDVRRWLKPRGRFTHKGSHGHALVIAGGVGCHGAAVLAASGCARSGVGLLTVHGVERTIQLVGAALPDAMTSLDGGADYVDQLPDLERYSAIAFGPGSGALEGPRKALGDLMTRWRGPLVLDADALNMLAQERDLLKLLQANVVLTPHPKEMDRLLGSSFSMSYERLTRTREFAESHGCTVVLKGAYTVVCSPDGRAYFNSTGNAGMAKGGSGDVLTGILVGLLAQGYDVLEASMISTYIHGLAGDLAAGTFGGDAMRASDLVLQLPEAWKRLRGT